MLDIKEIEWLVGLRDYHVLLLSAGMRPVLLVHTGLAQSQYYSGCTAPLYAHNHSTPLTILQKIGAEAIVAI